MKKRYSTEKQRQKDDVFLLHNMAHHELDFVMKLVDYNDKKQELKRLKHELKNHPGRIGEV